MQEEKASVSSVEMGNQREHEPVFIAHLEKVKVSESLEMTDIQEQTLLRDFLWDKDS